MVAKAGASRLSEYYRLVGQQGTQRKRESAELVRAARLGFRLGLGVGTRTGKPALRRAAPPQINIPTRPLEEKFEALIEVRRLRPHAPGAHARVAPATHRNPPHRARNPPDASAPAASARRPFPCQP